MKEKKCTCGELLNFMPSPFMTEEKRVCRKCGKIMYVEHRPIDWKKVNGGKK